MNKLTKRIIFKLGCLILLIVGGFFITENTNATASYCDPSWGYQCCNNIPCPEGMHCGLNGCVCDCVDEWGNCNWNGCY